MDSIAEAVFLHARRDRVRCDQQFNEKCEGSPIQMINSLMKTGVSIPTLRYYSNEMYISDYKINTNRTSNNDAFNANRSSVHRIFRAQLMNGNDYIFCIAHTIISAFFGLPFLCDSPSVCECVGV